MQRRGAAYHRPQPAAAIQRPGNAGILPASGALAPDLVGARASSCGAFDRPPLQVEQGLLRGQAATVTPKLPVVADHPVAGHDDR